VRRGLHLVGIALTGGLAVACGVSPQPLPPPEAVVIDTAQLTLTETGGGLVVTGAPGAVIEATTLRLTNLEGADPVVEVDVDPDGSFEASFGGSLFDLLRLQAFASQARSVPVDVTGTSSGGPVTVAPVPTACLQIDPPLELEGAPVGLMEPIQDFTITARNDCGGPVVLAAVDLRLGEGFQSLVGAQVPRTLAPGESFGIALGFKSMTTGVFEDVAILRLDAVDGPRRFVTLRGITQP
jgi:hypothetical protein